LLHLLSAPELPKESSLKMILTSLTSLHGNTKLPWEVVVTGSLSTTLTIEQTPLSRMVFFISNQHSLKIQLEKLH
jgi:hypothetical protein